MTQRLNSYIFNYIDIMRTKNIVSIFLLFLLLPGISFAETIDRIVAKINGDIVTFSELEDAVSSIEKVEKKNKKEFRKTFNKEKKKVLNKIIEQNLQLQYAKENKIEVTRDDIDMALEDIKKNNNFSDEMFEIMLEREGVPIKKYRASLRRQITLSKVLSYEVSSKIKINEKDVVRYYKKNKKKFLKPEEIRVYHVIFIARDKGDADELKKQKTRALRVLKLAKRGDDFEKLAKTYSEGPSKESGGDLGWVKRGSMIHSFEKAAFSLRKNEISKLVKTDYGYHIIKVTDRKEAKESTLAEIRDEIKNTLFKRKYSNKYDKWMAELKKNAFIEIYLDRISYKKRYASLNKKQKRAGTRSSNPKSNKKIRKKERIKTPGKETVNTSKKAKTGSKYVRVKDKIEISKFILNWEKARETKNQHRYFSFYSKNVKVNGVNRAEWRKKTKEEYEKYKFIDIETRDLKIFKRDDFYVAAFDQRFKSNIDDQIRIVRLYLTKNDDGFEISREKWLNSPDTHKEFSKKSLLSLDTIPKTTSKISKKRKRRRILQPLGLL